MNEQPVSAGASDDDIILMSGLSVAEDRAVWAHYAKRAEKSKRERLTLAARWALEHGKPAAMDSKGWPLDTNDSPLRPRAGSMPETQGSYRVAVRMAMARRTRRVNLAALAEADAFRLSSISLSDVPPAVSAEARTVRKEREQASETAMLW